MLVPNQLVSVKIVPSNCVYWASKGYSFDKVHPRWGEVTHIRVRASDLKPNSNVKVDCICDLCGRDYTNRFSRNKDVCYPCRKSIAIKGNMYGKKNRPTKERPPKKLVPSKEELEHLHIENKMSIRNLCEHYKRSYPCVRGWFTKHGVEIQWNRKERKINPDPETLRRLHIDEGKSFKNISTDYNLSDSQVGLLAKKYGIDNETVAGGESLAEIELREWMSTVSGMIFTKTRKFIPPQEIDIWSEHSPIAIEYCGLYWHSEANLSEKNYHLNKMISVENKGKQLITIFEHEWLERNDVVKSILKTKLGKNGCVIFARKCQIVEILDLKQVRTFLNEHHLQKSPNKIVLAVGIFDGKDLLGIMSFGPHHRQKSIYNRNIVLNRLVFRKETTVVGGASRMFKFAKDILRHQNYQNIISWSDNRWSNGDVYGKMGFVMSKIIPRDYMYCKGQKMRSKQSMTKKIMGCPKEITERDFAATLGWFRVWDCGKKSWIYSLSD